MIMLKKQVEKLHMMQTTMIADIQAKTAKMLLKILNMMKCMKIKVMMTKKMSH